MGIILSQFFGLMNSASKLGPLPQGFQGGVFGGYLRFRLGFQGSANLLLRAQGHRGLGLSLTNLIHQPSTPHNLQRFAVSPSYILFARGVAGAVPKRTQPRTITALSIILNGHHTALSIILKGPYTALSIIITGHYTALSIIRKGHYTA